MTEKTLRQTLRDRVVELRKIKGLSRQHLAALSKVGVFTLAGMEQNGQGITVTQLSNIALALEVAPYLLLAPHEEWQAHIAKVREEKKRGEEASNPKP